MFIVSLKYVKPIEVIFSHLEEHIAFLNANYEKGRFICSGPKDPRTGGIIISALTDEAELWNILKQDPFYIHQTSEYEVTNFIPTKCDEKFSCFIENDQ